MAVTPEMRAKVDFTDPYYARRPASYRGATPVMRTCAPNISRQENERHRRHLTHRSLPEGDVHRRRNRSMPMTTRCARRSGTQRGRFHFWRRDRAGVLGQRHRFRRVLHVLRQAVRGEPLFRRRHRHRRPQGNDLLRQSLNWACSGSGKKAATRICGCAIFPSARFRSFVTPSSRERCESIEL